jgi:hypothetical protein
MSDNVRYLPGVKPNEETDAQRRDQIISTIESVLELAKAGELDGIAVATLHRNKDTHSKWVFVEGHGLGLAASLSATHHQFYSDWCAGAQDD